MLHRRQTWYALALAYVSVFRTVVVGSCLVCAAVAWFMHVPWLLMASLCIAAGEFVECTYYLVVLNWGKRSGRLPNPG
jgi:uncharacterized membrane protein